jgi:hypothetical protein
MLRRVLHTLRQTTAVPPAICWTLDATHGVIWAHVLTHGVSEYRPEQPNCAASCAYSAAHMRHTPQLCGFVAGCRLAIRDGMHESLDVAAIDISDKLSAKQRLEFFRPSELSTPVRVAAPASRGHMRH